MKIVHAVANELGTAKGGTPGDQTGKEIRVADWYRRPWGFYLEPPDRGLGRRAAKIAEIIAAGNFGYDQVERWSGYKSIKKVGAENISAGMGDFDCSSLVITCYILAGLNISASGYTGSIEKIFTGKGFRCYKDAQHLDTPQAAVAGGMYCTAGAHVCICIGDGAAAPAVTVGADASAAKAGGGAEDAKRIRVHGSVWIHSAPDKEKTSRVKHPAKNGEVLTVTGEYVVDGEVFMWETERGWISADPKYTEVI